MVTKYGMSDSLGPVVYGSEHGGDEVFLGRDFTATRNYAETTASLIDNEIKSIINIAYNSAEEILKEYMDKLHYIAGFLFRSEVMDETQFDAVMSGNPTYDELDDMMDEKRRKSEEENKAKQKRDDEDKRRKEEEARKKEAEFRFIRPDFDANSDDDDDDNDNDNDNNKK